MAYTIDSIGVDGLCCVTTLDIIAFVLFNDVWEVIMPERSAETRVDREVQHFEEVYKNEIEVGKLMLSLEDKRRFFQPPKNTRYSKEYFYHLLSPLQGKDVLEIACGGGLDSCLASLFGAKVFAYDLCPAAIELTRKRAELNGVSDKVHLQVCGSVAEAFPGQAFDAVLGFAALHHLPLSGLGEAIHARLKPGGIAVFVEPVINSQALDAFRRCIPYRPVEITEDENPLNDRDIQALADPFLRLERREFEFLSRIYPLFRNHPAIVYALHELDYHLLKIPLLRRFASVVVFSVSK